MEIWQAIVLGALQGLTEFIPVSSTAHLILAQRLTGWHFGTDVEFAFNVLIQLGTTVAVVVYFWRDLWSLAIAALDGIARGKPLADPRARLGWMVLAGTVPAIAVGLLFKKQIAALHGQATIVALVLIVASALLFLGERAGKQTRQLDGLRWLDALVIGAWQALATIPGVSRSGATISGGLFAGLERESAARFSFLLSVPALVGASVLAAPDLLTVPNLGALLPPLLAGFAAAALVGFATIGWLLAYLARRPMDLFAWYRIAAGIVFLLVIFLRA